MVRYPIRLPREHYRGSKPNLRQKNQLKNLRIQEMENAVNRMIAEMPDGIHVMLYGTIAADLGISVDEVRNIMFGLDCGHNGFTVVKGNPPDAPV